MSVSNRGIRSPRGRSQYDSEQYSRGDSALYAGDQFINEKLAQANLVRAKYKEGPLVFRIWPALDPMNPDKLLPGRINSNDLGFSEFMVRTAVVRYVGLTDAGGQPVTYIPYYPWNAQAAKGNDPYRTLYFAAKAANKAGEFGTGQAWNAKWNRLLLSDKNEQAALSRPGDAFFAQGIVYRNGDKDYTVPGDKSSRKLPLGMHQDDRLPVIMLTSAVGEAIQQLLRIRKAEPGDVDELREPWKLFKYGDPTGIYNPKTSGLDGGLIFIVFNPKNTKVTQHTSWNQTIADVQGYEVAISKSFPSKTHPNVTTQGRDMYMADLDSKQVELIKQKWQFWFDESTPDVSAPGILRVPPLEEQCLLLAKAFKAVPQMLEFAWSEHPEFLTDEVRAVMTERAVAVRPGDASEYEQPAGRPARAPRAGATDVTQQVPAAAGARAPRPGAAPVEDEFGDEAPAASTGPVNNDTFEDTPEETLAAATPETAEDDFAADDKATDNDAEVDVEQEAEAEAQNEDEVAATDETGDDDTFPDPKAAEAAAKLAGPAEDDYGFGDQTDEFDEESKTTPAQETPKVAESPKTTAAPAAPKATAAPAATAATKAEDDKAKLKASLDMARNRAAARTSPAPATAAKPTTKKK